MGGDERKPMAGGFFCSRFPELFRLTYIIITIIIITIIIYGAPMFYGRIRDLAFLNEKYQSKKAELVIMYGRRRIGKTETLLHFSKGKPSMYYACTDCPDAQQLQVFSQVILPYDHVANQFISSYASWVKAFEALPTLDNGVGKKVIIIDEFPLMCRGNNEIPSILQNRWDQTFHSSNIMLVLCGSSMGFMEKEILSEKSPLFGRATGIWKMEEMPFHEAKEFFPNHSIKDQMLAYAILGGVPHYLEQFDKNETIEENIKTKILAKGSILFDEVNYLLHQELRETSTYNLILQAIAMGSTRLGDIASKTGITEKTKLITYLTSLRELGIVEREFSMQSSIKEKAKQERGIYRIKNNFFSFWYRFLYARTSLLEAGDVEGYSRYIVAPQLHSSLARPFEKMCTEYLQEKNKQDKLPFHFINIGRWWRNDSEIDIMATGPNQELLLGECKLTNHKAQAEDIDSFLVKTSSFPSAYCYYFSFNGFQPSAMKRSSEVLHLTLVTPEEMW